MIFQLEAVSFLSIFFWVISCIKTNHFSNNSLIGIVHAWRENALNQINLTYRETKMEIMIILTLGLLAVVAMNELTDH